MEVVQKIYRKALDRPPALRIHIAGFGGTDLQQPLRAISAHHLHQGAFIQKLLGVLQHVKVRAFNASQTHTSFMVRVRKKIFK